MRIISGKYGGRIFRPPGNFKARPTTDLAKEGLFNILTNRIDFAGMVALDLFSGTGSIGVELISRGCAEVDMIEKNYQHYKFIKKLLDDLSIENAQVFKADVFKALGKLKKEYQLIFADPPYDLPELIHLPELILSSEHLQQKGWLILEHPGNYSFTEISGFFEQRKYGSVNFSFFEKL